MHGSDFTFGACVLWKRVRSIGRPHDCAGLAVRSKSSARVMGLKGVQPIRGQKVRSKVGDKKCLADVGSGDLVPPYSGTRKHARVCAEGVV
jgi:hypothetical protein